MTSPAEPDSEDLAAVEAERDALQEEVEQLRRRRRVGTTARRTTVVVGVVLSCLLLTAAVVGVWANRSLLRTETFADRAGSLIDDPAVQNELSLYLSGQLSELIDAQSVIEDALPSEAGVLAAPLSGAVDEFLLDQTQSFVSSEPFANLWKGAVEVAHSRAVNLLEGNSDLVETDAESITINLLPVINEIIGEVTSASPEIFGQEVSLPDVTLDDVPDDARKAIEDATGIDLDDDFGTFTIYDEGTLQTAQDGVQLADTLVIALVILAPLAIAGTIWLSHRRRRTILQLSFGILIGMVLIRRFSFLFQGDLVELFDPQSTRDAIDATSSTFLDPLRDGALWIGIVAIVVAAVAWVTGSYPWAIQVREWAMRSGRTVAGAVSDQAQDQETAAWVARNEDALKLGGWAVGLVVLLFVELSWIWFFVVLGVVGLYQLALSRVAEGAFSPEDTPPETAPSDTSA